MKRLFFLVLVLPFIYAGSAFAQEINTYETISLGRNEVVNNDYFAAGEAVTLSGTVNGDAYIAGGNVLMDGVVNGDLLVAGGNVTLRGSVKNDVRLMGGSVTISSEVGGNTTVVGGNVIVTDEARLSGSLVGASGNIQLFSPIGKGATIGAGQVMIGNSVGGDVLTGVGKLTLTSDAKIDGDLTYYSDERADIASSSSVSGEIVQRMVPKSQFEDARETARGVISGATLTLKIIDLIISLLIGLLFLQFFPIYTDNVVGILTKRIGRTMLVGFLAFIIVPILFIVLLITIIGIPLALLLGVGLMIIAYISKVFVAIAIGRKIIERTSYKLQVGWVLLIGLLVWGIIAFVPVLGGIFTILSAFAGVGAILWEKKNIYNLLRSKEMI